MTGIAITRKWFDEIKNLVVVSDPYFYTENGTDYVEFDTNEEEFNKVSKELGWMK